MRGDVIPCPDCAEKVVVPLTPVGPGTLIDGYKVIRKIGTGGMGNVYLVEQTSMSRLVALKVLPPALTQDITFLERFLSEVRMQGSLSHPNIATAYDAGKYGEIYYMAMEYVEGFDLHDMIDNRGQIDERAALKISRKIALGLGYAWKKSGLIHRDIKPSNVIIAQDAEVKILDLGVSKSHAKYTDKPSTGEMVIGTPHYMSPEQAKESSSVDTRADMYSLGATLYHMVTGRTPFEGANLVEVVTKQLSEKAPAPQSLNPKLSDAFVRLLDVMMAREPKYRYPNWEACGADILRVLSGSMPEAAAPGPAHSLLEPSTRKSTRRTTVVTEVPVAVPATSGSPKKVIAGVMGAIAVAGAILYGITRTGDAPPVEPVSSAYPNAEDTSSVVKASPAPKRIGDKGKRANVEKRRDLEAQFGVLTDDSRRERDEPSRIDALKDLRREAEAYEFGALAKRCEIAIGRRAYALQEGIKDVLSGLENSASELLEAGNYLEAASLYREYNDEWADETEVVRLERASDIDVLGAEVQGKAFASLVQNVAGDIITERGSGTAINRLQAAEDDPVLKAFGDKVGEVSLELTQALRLHTGLIDTFTNQVGQEIFVQLRKGPERLIIEGVSGNAVQVTKRIPQGELAMTFALRDLSIQEKFIRLDGQEGSEANLLRGLLALEARQDGAAARLFALSEGTLARALAEQLNRPTVDEAFGDPEEFLEP